MMDLDALCDRAKQALPSWNEPDAALAKAKKLEAASLFEQAAEAGHLPSMTWLAQWHPTAERKLYWCERLAERGEVRTVTSALTDGLTPSAWSESVRARAEEGVPWAQHALAQVYRLGLRDNVTGALLVVNPKGALAWIAPTSDPDRVGLEWLNRACVAGWAPAQLEMVPVIRRSDPAAALALLQDATRPEATLVPEQRLVGTRLRAELLEQTHGPTEELLRVHEGLASFGDGASMTWLGDRYRTGEGVAADLELAQAWYERALEKGQPSAARELGRMYEDGVGVPVDDARARSLYETAAELGADPFARDKLAEKYGLEWYRRKGKKSATAKPKAVKRKK